MFNEKYNNTLGMFDALHICTLVVFLCITLTIIYFRNYFKKEKPDKLFRYVLASVCLVLELGFHIWTATNGGYSIDMLPLLGLCSTTNILTIYSLFTNNKKLMSIIYYYALTGAFFSLIFIDIAYALPHFRYFHYFIVHYGFMLAAIYSVATGKINLNKKSLYLACIIIFSWSIVMLVVDILASKNYYYMLESPVKEISDFFGKGLYSVLWIVTITLLIHGWHYLTLALCRFCSSFPSFKQHKIDSNNT